MSKQSSYIVEFLYLELTTPIISEQRGLYFHIQPFFYGFQISVSRLFEAYLDPDQGSRCRAADLDWHYSCYSKLPKPSLKIRTAKRHLLKLSWPIQRLRLKSYFFRSKTFVFPRQKAETFCICLKKNFMKPHKISTHSAYSNIFLISIYSIHCLIELKFCEI